jgi:hypothetical protein
MGVKIEQMIMKNLSVNQEKKIFRVLMLLHALLIVFWLVFKYYNVYQTKIGGAIAELLWLPMLLLLFVLPLTDLFLWFRDNFRIRSNFLILLGLSSIPLLVIISGS